MSLYVLFTSCVYPNTAVKVARFDPEVRLRETIDAVDFNILSLQKLNIVAECFILDSSVDFSYFERMKLILMRKQYSNIKVIPIYCDFNEIEKKMIAEKGKGFSEILMIKKLIEKLVGWNDNSIILKISARYKIINLNEYISKTFEMSGVLGGSYSIVLKKINTVIFAFKISPLLDNINDILSEVDDSKSQYIESVFVSKFDTKIEKWTLFPLLKKDQTSGSTGHKFVGLYSFLRKIIYKYF